MTYPIKKMSSTIIIGAMAIVVLTGCGSPSKDDETQTNQAPTPESSFQVIGTYGDKTHAGLIHPDIVDVDCVEYTTGSYYYGLGAGLDCDFDHKELTELNNNLEESIKLQREILAELKK